MSNNILVTLTLFFFISWSSFGFSNDYIQQNYSVDVEVENVTKKNKSKRIKRTRDKKKLDYKSWPKYGHNVKVKQEVGREVSDQIIDDLFADEPTESVEANSKMLAVPIAKIDTVSPLAKSFKKHKNKYAYPVNFTHPKYKNAPKVKSDRKTKELNYDLDVEYATHQFKTLQEGVEVTKELHLRSYNGKLIGPTLVARPGDTLRIRLNNLLPAEPHHPHCENPDDCDHNRPHNFNTTNLHTHGLHVDPSGNSDNVFVKISGGESFEYEIHIPEDHVAGTFWYHAHVHGSTTVQVASGVHGALIVRGDYDRVPAIKAAKERIMVLQTISFDDNGEIEGNENFFVGKWNSENWENGWHLSVNGQVMPEITMRPGSTEHWRFVHAGVREDINLKVVNACDSRYDVPLVQVAADGIAFRKKRLADDRGSFLAGGYRSDVMFKPRRRGVYYLIDASSDESAVVPDSYCDKKREPGDEFVFDEFSQNIIARITVKGIRKPMRLPSNASLAAVKRPKIIEDSELVPEVQNVTFNIVPKDGVDPSDPDQFIGDNFIFTIDGRSFDPNHYRELKLGQAQTWYLSSQFVDHPYHIHVNPFEVITRDDNGKIIDRYWRDTVLVRQPIGDQTALDERVEIRTRYETFTGAFVLHCHILDHEDRGMMERVVINP